MANNILRKIEKLLRLAEGGNVYEAANAAAKAKAIADKYNIALEVLKAKGYEVYTDEIIDYIKTYGKPFRENLSPWELVLSKVVADHNGCRVYILYHGSKDLNIAGRSSDIEVVDMLFSWLRTQIAMAILKQERRDHEWIDCFTLGIIHLVNERMTEEIRNLEFNELKFEGASLAIVKLENRGKVVDEFLKSISFTPTTNEINNPEAFLEGRAVGESIQLKIVKGLKQ